MRNQVNVNNIVVTSNVENGFVYDENYLVLKIKEIKTNMRGNRYYECKVLNDEINFDSEFTYVFFENEIQTPNENQLIEINKNYLRRN